MARFNIAVLSYCPPLPALLAAFTEFGGSQKFALTEVEQQSEVVYASLGVDGDVTIPTLDRDKKAIESQTVTKTKMYPFRIEPLADGRGILQVYAGSESIFKTFEAFLQDCVSDDHQILIEKIDVDPLALWHKVFERNKVKAKDKKGREIDVFPTIKKAKFSNYEAKGGAAGAFIPTFKDSGEGQEFIETFIGQFKTMTVEYGYKKERVRLTYGNTASFSISAGAEVGDDSPRWMLEELIDIPAGTAVQADADGSAQGSAPVGDDGEEVITGACPQM